MSVAVLDQDERAILVALINNDFSYQHAAEELGLEKLEVKEYFEIFKKNVRDGRVNAKWLSERDVARELDCGLLCARMLLQPYTHLVIKKKRSNGQTIRYYPPAVVPILKPYFNLFEDGFQWFCVTQIKHRLNKDFDWVRGRLEAFQSKARPKIASDGKLRLHYPETVVMELEATRDKPIPAGDHLHIAKISRLTGEDPAKIRRIIDLNSIEAEERYVPRYGLTSCYSPQSVERIKHILKSIKPQGDWVTANFIAQALGLTYYRVLSLIKLAGIKGEERFSETANRVHTHYPPATLQLVKEMVDGIKHHGGWHTSERIQKLTGRSHGWVRKRLEGDRFPREMRLAKNNVPRMHYPPWVAYILYTESRQT